MSNGICILAQNNKTTNYVEQTYALALSALANAPTTNISIVTNDKIPSAYKDVFDKIIPIPWGDAASETDWKTYRNEPITSRYYRKAFDANNLPDVYTGMYQFSKGNEAYDFFKLLDVIMQNWNVFYKKYAANSIQNWNSVDLSAAIALKILDTPGNTLNDNSMMSFTHMKPNAQNLVHAPSKWTDALSVDFGNDSVYINGYKQSGVLHYVEDEFLTADMLKWLEERV